MIRKCEYCGTKNSGKLVGQHEVFHCSHCGETNIFYNNEAAVGRLKNRMKERKQHENNIKHIFILIAVLSIFLIGARLQYVEMNNHRHNIVQQANK